MSIEVILGIVSFFLTMIGAAFVGSRLNEGKHRKEDLRLAKNDILDLTKILERSERISKHEREEIEKLPSVKSDDISRILHEWPEVSGNFDDPTASGVKKSKRGKLSKV